MGILGLLGIDKSNASYYLKDFKNAYRFRPDVNPPRQQFNGYVNFIVNRVLFYQLFGKPASVNEYRTTLSSLVKTADLPSVNFTTETKNSFNRKKIIQTGVEYQPVNISVFDTVGNEWLITLMKYFAYYYMDPRNKQRTNNRDIEGEVERMGGTEDVASIFGGDVWDSNVAGYNPQVDSHFFERIDYVLYHGNKIVQYSLINPKLTSFKPGTIDYSASDCMGFDLTFEYERFTVHNNLNSDMTIEDADRFELANNLKGPLFEDAMNTTLPLTMQSPVNLDQILGTKESPRTRTQAIYGKGTPGYNIGTPGEPIVGDPTNPTPADVSRSNAPQTYGSAAVFAPPTDADSESNPFTDFLGDIADTALSALINGGNVKESTARVVLNTVQNTVATRAAQQRGSKFGDG